MAIYKRGQGVIARVSTAILLGGLTIMGVIDVHRIYREVRPEDTWLGWLSNFFFNKPTWGQWSLYIYPLIVLAMGAFGVWFLTNRPKYAEHLIDTEIELKKVVWPRQQEILRATGIVLSTVIVMCVLLFCFDQIFQEVLFWIF